MTRQTSEGSIDRTAHMILSLIEDLLRALRDVPVLRPDQMERVEQEAKSFDDPQAFAKHLVRQGLLSSYQARKLLLGKGHELLVGPYIVLDKLGEGGMGVVYKARKPRMERIVALKVIRTKLLDNQNALKRFQREIKATETLDHPNIVRLWDAEEFNGQWSLVLEYVDGLDLTQLVMKSGPLPAAVACDYIRQGALGLQHAHEQGYVHRDIKPSNLLVTMSGRPGRDAALGGGLVKILDMGLARPQGGLDLITSFLSVTQDGTVVGTPDFMAPEQAKNSKTVDVKADQYSLGCTFFYLLTGNPPFTKGSTVEKLVAHQVDPPPDVRALRSDVPEGAAAVLNRLLAKRPEQRFASMAELATALAPFSGGIASPSTDVVPLEPSRSFRLERPDELQRSDRRTEANVHPATAVVSAEAVAASTREVSAPNPAGSEAGRTEGVARRRARRDRILLVVAFGILLGVVFALLAGKVLRQTRTTEPTSEPEGTGRARATADGNLDANERNPDGQPRLAVLDRYLPDDARQAIVLNVAQLVQSNAFATTLRPRFEARTTELATALGMDPLIAIRRCVGAVVALNPTRLVVVLESDVPWVGAKLRTWLEDGKDRVDAKDHGAGGTTYRIYVRKTELGVTLHVVPLDERTVVIASDTELAMEVIAKHAGDRTTSFRRRQFAERLKRYDPKATLWAVVDGSWQDATWPLPLSEAGVTAVEAAVTLGTGARGTVTLQGTDEKQLHAAADLARTAALQLAGSDKRLNARLQPLFRLLSEPPAMNRDDGEVRATWKGELSADQFRDWVGALFPAP